MKLNHKKRIQTLKNFRANRKSEHSIDITTHAFNPQHSPKTDVVSKRWTKGWHVHFARVIFVHICQMCTAECTCCTGGCRNGSTRALPTVCTWIANANICFTDQWFLNISLFWCIGICIFRLSRWRFFFVDEVTLM